MKAKYLIPCVAVMIIAALFLSPAQALLPAYALSYNYKEYTYNDMYELKDIISSYQNDKERLHEAADILRSLETFDDECHSEIIAELGKSWRAADAEQQEHQRLYDMLHSRWLKKEEEYPVATYIWTYLKDLGYSDEVTAGILGNMMVETGGCTLAIQPEIYSSDRLYYGICQWSKQFFREVHGMSLEEQCNYLVNDMQYQFDVFGYAYDNNFGYQEFLEMTDVQKAAKAFAKVYEKCHWSGYSKRQSCAIEAYNYFVGE